MDFCSELLKAIKHLQRLHDEALHSQTCQAKVFLCFDSSFPLRRAQQLAANCPESADSGHDINISLRDALRSLGSQLSQLIACNSAAPRAHSTVEATFPSCKSVPTAGEVHSRTAQCPSQEALTRLPKLASAEAKLLDPSPPSFPSGCIDNDMSATDTVSNASEIMLSNLSVSLSKQGGEVMEPRESGSCLLVQILKDLLYEPICSIILHLCLLVSPAGGAKSDRLVRSLSQEYVRCCQILTGRSGGWDPESAAPGPLPFPSPLSRERRQQRVTKSHFKERKKNGSEYTPIKGDAAAPARVLDLSLEARESDGGPLCRYNGNVAVCPECAQQYPLLLTWICASVTPFVLWLYLSRCLLTVTLAPATHKIALEPSSVLTSTEVCHNEEARAGQSHIAYMIRQSPPISPFAASSPLSKCLSGAGEANHNCQKASPEYQCTALDRRDAHATSSPKGHGITVGRCGNERWPSRGAEVTVSTSAATQGAYRYLNRDIEAVSALNDSLIDTISFPENRHNTISIVSHHNETADADDVLGLEFFLNQFLKNSRPASTAIIVPINSKKWCRARALRCQTAVAAATSVVGTSTQATSQLQSTPFPFSSELELFSPTSGASARVSYPQAQNSKTTTLDRSSKGIAYGQHSNSDDSPFVNLAANGRIPLHLRNSYFQRSAEASALLPPSLTTNHVACNRNSMLTFPIACVGDVAPLQPSVVNFQLRHHDRLVTSESAVSWLPPVNDRTRNWFVVRLLKAIREETVPLLQVLSRPQDAGGGFMKEVKEAWKSRTRKAATFSIAPSAPPLDRALEAPDDTAEEDDGHNRPRVNEVPFLILIGLLEALTAFEFVPAASGLTRQILSKLFPASRGVSGLSHPKSCSSYRYPVDDELIMEVAQILSLLSSSSSMMNTPYRGVSGLSSSGSTTEADLRGVVKQSLSQCLLRSESEGLFTATLYLLNCAAAWASSSAKNHYEGPTLSLAVAG